MNGLKVFDDYTHEDIAPQLAMKAKREAAGTRWVSCTGGGGVNRTSGANF